MTTMGSGATRPAQALTHRAVEALRPSELPYRLPDQRSAGLAVRVAPSGAKTWDVAYRIKAAGKVRRASLGRFPDVSLEDARIRADALTRAARLGRDLIAEETRAKAVADARLTIAQLVEVYVQRRIRGRFRTAMEIERRLKRALAPIEHQYANEIRRRDIRELLDRVADQGHPREAEQRRHTIGAMFKWALAQDLVDTNPTAGLTTYGSGPLRDRALSEQEVRQLWPWLTAANLPPHVADILRLQIALGARCGEVSGLDAVEIDLPTSLWTLPASRSKNGRPRVTPLVGAARNILEERLQSVDKGLLFPAATGRPLTSAHVGHALLARRGRLPVELFTTHDLRRSVATLMVEMAIPLDLIAAILGHESGAKETRTLIRHYVRTDLIERKKIALEAWDRKLALIVTGGLPSTVLNISEAKGRGGMRST
jgi:integrase